MESLRNTVVTSGCNQKKFLSENSEEWTLNISSHSYDKCRAFVETYNNNSNTHWIRIPIGFDETEYNSKILEYNSRCEKIACAFLSFIIFVVSGGYIVMLLIHAIRKMEQL